MGMNSHVDKLDEMLFCVEISSQRSPDALAMQIKTLTYDLNTDFISVCLTLESQRPRQDVTRTSPQHFRP